MVRTSRKRNKRELARKGKGKKAGEEEVTDPRLQVGGEPSLLTCSKTNCQLLESKGDETMPQRRSFSVGRLQWGASLGSTISSW